MMPFSTSGDQTCHKHVKYSSHIGEQSLTCMESINLARNEQLIRQHKLLQLLEISRFGRHWRNYAAIWSLT